MSLNNLIAAAIIVIIIIIVYILYRARVATPPLTTIPVPPPTTTTPTTPTTPAQSPPDTTTPPTTPAQPSLPPTQPTPTTIPTDPWTYEPSPMIPEQAPPTPPPATPTPPPTTIPTDPWTYQPTSTPVEIVSVPQAPVTYTPPPPGSPILSTKTLPNGKGQYIKYGPNAAYCLDLGNNSVASPWLQIYKCFNTGQMKWIIPASKGQIKHFNHPTYCLDATAAIGKAGGAPLGLTLCKSGVTGQNWIYDPATDTFCAAGQCLNNANFKIANSNMVQAYPKSGTSAQKWLIGNTA